MHGVGDEDVVNNPCSEAQGEKDEADAKVPVRFRARVLGHRSQDSMHRWREFPCCDHLAHTSSQAPPSAGGSVTQRSLTLSPAFAQRAAKASGSRQASA